MNKLDWGTFKPKLGGWGKYLQELFESEEMYNLFQELKNSKERITPASKDLFKFLELCSPDKLKLIIIGMDSYPGIYKNRNLQATGIAFDCSNSPDKKCQPSLKSFWEGLSEEYGTQFPEEHDIKYLSEREGVMLANRALTCKLNKSGSMMGKWDIFWKYFIEQVIGKQFPGVPFLLLGKEAQKLRAYIFEMQNPVFTLSHPSFAARNQTIWQTEGKFKQIDNLITDQNGQEFVINWGREIKEPMIINEDLPF